MPINVEKIKKELSKGDVEELTEAFFELKKYTAELVEAAQRQADEKATSLQTTLERIKS